MKRIVMLTLMLSLLSAGCALAGTQTQCIPSESFGAGPNTQSATVGNIPATTNRGSTNYWRFDNNGQQVVIIRGVFPANTTSTSLTGWVFWRNTNASDTGSVEWDAGYRVTTSGSLLTQSLDAVSSGAALGTGTDTAQTNLGVYVTQVSAIAALDVNTGLPCADVNTCAGQSGKPMWITLRRNNSVGGNLPDPTDVTMFCYSWNT